jgi:hypothetical protein
VTLVSEEMKGEDFSHLTQTHTIRQNIVGEFVEIMKKIILLTRKFFQQSPKSSVMKTAGGHMRNYFRSQNR